MTDTAAGYTRLSQQSDTSIDAQKASIRAYADEHGFTLTTIHNDGEGASGYSQDREAYQDLVDAVREGDLDAVIVRDTTRLGRDYDDRQLLQIYMRRTGTALHETQRGRINIDDEFQAGVEGIRAAADDQRKRMEIQKAREAVQQRVEDGCYHGTPPRGLQFADDNCHLERDPEEWENVEHVYELLDEGDATYAEIQEETGVPPSQISRMKQRGREYYDDKLTEYGVDAGTPRF